MKYLSFLIVTVAFSVCLNGCAANRAPVNALGQQRVSAPTFFETQKAELAQLAKKPVPTTVASRQEQARMGKGNSTVETMSDSFGNRVESRIFHGDTLLKMVVVQTSVDGQKQALIYGNNGDVKTAPPHLLDSVLISAASEIAKSVEIVEGRRENLMLTALQTAAAAPLDPDSAMSGLTIPPITEMPPVTENAPTGVAPTDAAPAAPAPSVEPVKPAVKTVDSEAAAAKLRLMMQESKVNRVKSPAKDQSPK